MDKCLEIVNIPGKGRGIISRRHFKEGESIFEESSFVSSQFSWNQAYGYLACDHCMRPLETTEENVRRLANNNSITLPFKEYDPINEWIPKFCVCVQCGVKYCSDECRMSALNKYHRTACMGSFRQDDTHPINILNNTWKKMHYPPESGSILIIVRLLAMFKQSEDKNAFLETIKSFQSTSVNEEKQIYHKMIGPNFEKDMEDLYKQFCICFQDEDLKIFTTWESFKSFMAMIGTNSQGIATSSLAEYVKKISTIPLPKDEKDQLDNFIDDLYNQVREFAGEFIDNEGSGLYQLQSKINHSCVPNAQSTFPYSNDVVVLKALKDIQPNEEICISYLDECQLDRSRHTRHAFLRENYLFVCNCPKCEEQVKDPDETSEDESDEDDSN